jgi:hypothetical protein
MAAVADPPLLGREAALAHLARAIDRAGAGRGSFLWVSGEAGIGKTTLLEHTAVMADGAGLRVLRGAAWDDPGTPPFWLWVQVLREAAAGAGTDQLREHWGARAREALTLLPELRGAQCGSVAAADGLDRFALFDSVQSVLATVVAERPLLLALDDLHWTDAGSLRLLRFLTRASTMPMVVVGTWRDGEAAAPEVAAIAVELAARSERIGLGGLDRAAVIELVQRTAGFRISEADADRVCHRTGGNPLFVGEMARLARDRGVQDVLAQVPDSADALIRRRLAHMSQGCHEILAIAAVAGTANAVDTVAALAGRDRSAVVAAVDEAVGAGLADHRRGRVDIAHPLIRDCLVRSLPTPLAREVHLAAAELVASDPTAAAEHAHHLVAALPLADLGRALAATRRAAATALAARAYEEAVEHRTVELSLARDSADESAALLGRGAALLASGALDAAREDFLRAADLARGRDDAVGFAEAALGFAAGMTGFEVRLRDQSQITLLEEALVRLGTVESALRADVMARLSVALTFENVAERRAELADQAVALARRLDAPRSVAHALAAHCDAIAGPDHAERRIEEARDVVMLAQGEGDRGLELLGLRLLIVSLLETGAIGPAKDAIGSFAAIAASVGQPTYTCYTPVFRGFLAHLEGNLDEMIRCSHEVDRIGAQADSENAEVLAMVLRAWVAVERCRFDDYPSEFNAIMDTVSQVGETGVAITALMPGQSADVRAAAWPGLPQLLARLPQDSEYLSGMLNVVLTLWEHGGPLEAATTLHDRLAPHRGRYIVDGIAAGAGGPVDRWLGMLDLVRDRLDEAEEHLTAGLAIEEGMGARLGIAHGHALLAEVCGRRRGPGDADRATSHAAVARAAYVEMSLTMRADRLSAPPRSPSAADLTETARLHRAGDMWEVTFRGRTVQVRDAKGMRDLASLLARAGHELHALDLLVPAGERSAVPTPSDTGEVLDSQARDAYRARLSDLDEEIDRASVDGDSDALEAARREREFLVAELSAAYGLGGRVRRTGDAAERARGTVTWRLREAIKRIERVHPELGAHLRRSVRTGTFCSYDPDRVVAWEVGTLTS